MGIQQHVSQDDGAVAALVAGLEAADFGWAARVGERWLGMYESLDEEDGELDRVAISGRIGARWFVAVCIVDGSGQVQAMSGCRDVGSRSEAQAALARAR